MFIAAASLFTRDHNNPALIVLKRTPPKKSGQAPSK
jgi:hypothetical protein